MRTQLLTVAFCGAVMLGSAGCGGSEEPQPAPPAEATAQTPAVPQNKPMTLTGCLRAGEGTDTFVLTTAQAQQSAETATYQLRGAQGVNLRDHIGQRVEVSGVVRSEQEMASSSASRPAANEKATGTTGTPTVQTRTQLQVRELDVNSITPTGGKCE
jgi:hypothetical protein